MKAVLFDFDGVIIDSEWPIYETWKELFAREGQSLEVEMYVQCIGSDFGGWSPEAYLEELTGKSYDWEQENAARQVKIERALEGVALLPGVRESMEAIVKNGIKLAIVSSSSHRWVDRWVEVLGLRDLVEEVVCRGDAPRVKPAPDLYAEAVKRFSEKYGIRAEQCLVIEDSLNGVKAGKAAGCQVVAVPSRLTSCLDFGLADEIWESLEVGRFEVA